MAATSETTKTFSKQEMNELYQVLVVCARKTLSNVLLSGHLKEMYDSLLTEYVTAVTIEKRKLEEWTKKVSIGLNRQSVRSESFAHDSNNKFSYVTADGVLYFILLAPDSVYMEPVASKSSTGSKTQRIVYNYTGNPGVETVEEAYALKNPFHDVSTPIQADVSVGKVYKITTPASLYEYLWIAGIANHDEDRNQAIVCYAAVSFDGKRPFIISRFSFVSPRGFAARVSSGELAFYGATFAL